MLSCGHAGGTGGQTAAHRPEAGNASGPVLPSTKSVIRGITMKWKLVGDMVLCTAAILAPVALARDAASMPPNPDKIGAALIQRGAISATATLAQKDAAVESYLKTKLQGGGPDQNANPLARKLLRTREEAINSALSPSDARGRK